MITFNKMLQLEIKEMKDKHKILNVISKDIGVTQVTFWRQMNNISPISLRTIEKLECAGYINIEQGYGKERGCNEK